MHEMSVSIALIEQVERIAAERDARSVSVITVSIGPLSGVEADLLAVAGDASLCAISKNAGSVPAAKYFEGRLVALKELGRSLGSADEGDPGAITPIHESWVASLAAATDRGAGSDWLAYYAGGVDELEDLARLLSPNG